MRKSSAAGKEIQPALLGTKRAVIKEAERLYLGEIPEHNNFLSELDKVSRQGAPAS